MATRSFDGPGREGESFVTTSDAARWFCVSEETFRELVAELAPWIRPQRHGKKLLWDVDDVIFLRHAMVRRQVADATPADGADGDGRNKKK